ncbi:MAG: ABC transporter substrate-binding protein [Spirochaetota bacterium]|nr:MAG: ABC transporter substrate-binding protein [Spirochaetota bacterium]
MKKILLIMMIICLMPAAAVFAQEKVTVSHALALHGDIKYGPDFKHFDYVNPRAPKGGTVKLAGIGSFDSLNPFILKGVSASGVGLLFDTLTEQSADEPFSEYGLLAETIELPKDRSWVAYNLRKEARWHDGTSITADDVVFTFNTLKEKGAPFYRYYYQDVVKAERLSKHKVRFVFKDGLNPELPLIMGQLPVISKKYYSEHPFDKTSLEPPVGSGPYRVVDVKPGRSITYQRDPNYWGRNVPVMAGRYNFDIIRYEYYRDETVVVEAFKAGEYDFRSENVAKIWATAYKGSNFDNGYIIAEELSDENPTGMQAWVFNTRRPIFQDSRVRFALAHLFDFEWTNRTLFYGQYSRIASYFENSELAAKGLPSPKELKLLEPYRNKLPREVFTAVYNPPAPEKAGNLRPNIRKALELLREAGWQLEGGKLVNNRGEQFAFEFLIFQPATERIAIPYKKNLELIGIDMTIRTVDTSQYVNRLDNYDFDMTSVWWRQSLSPGNEQRDFWSSEAADRPGTRNLAGIKDPVVDALINEIITAPDRQSLVAACRALDRVLLWGHYVVPNWYSRKYRIAYWNKFSKPNIKPKYALGFFDTWWVDPDKDKALAGKQ